MIENITKAVNRKYPNAIVRSNNNTIIISIELISMNAYYFNIYIDLDSKILDISYPRTILGAEGLDTFSYQISELNCLVKEISYLLGNKDVLILRHAEMI